MSRTIVVTARVDADTRAGLDRLAAAQQRSCGWLMARAIEAYVREEIAMLDFIQVGIDAADRGELTPHDEVMREIKARRPALHAAAAE